MRVCSYDNRNTGGSQLSSWLLLFIAGEDKENLATPDIIRRESMERGDNVSIAVKLFTHTDLDGVGCAVVARVAFADAVDIEYCNYDDVDQKVEDFILSEKWRDYDVIFITDISVVEDVAERIEQTCGDRLVLIDHHETALWLNDYGWARVTVYEGEDSRASGTSLFYNFLAENRLIKRDAKKLKEFAECVRRYDTWEWQTKYKDEHPKRLNDLLKVFGRYVFCDRFTENPSIDFTKTEQTILDIEQRRIKYYIDSHAKGLKEITTEEGYRIGVVFAENYLSELGNRLAEDYPHLDFIAMINLATGSISYRSNKDTVHLGMFAQTRGGGGHDRSAGSPISQELRDSLIQVILRKRG